MAGEGYGVEEVEVRALEPTTIRKDERKPQSQLR